MVASLLLPTAVGNQPSLGLSPDGLHAVVAGQHVLQTISLSAEDGSMACEVVSSSQQSVVSSQ